MKKSIFAKALRSTLVMAIVTALFLGTALMVSAGIGGFPGMATTLPEVNGITTTVARVGGDFDVPGTANFVTFSFEGTATQAGTLRVLLAGPFSEPDQVQYIRVRAGEVFTPNPQQNVVYVVSYANSGSFTMTPSVTFAEDIHHSGSFYDETNLPIGVTATGLVSFTRTLATGEREYSIEVNLAGAANINGTATVALDYPDTVDLTYTTSGNTSFSIARNRNVAGNGVVFTVLLSSGSIADVDLDFSFVSAGLATVNFVDEYIFFNDDVLFAVVPNTAAFRDEVRSGERFARNLERARWTPSMNWSFDITRSIPARDRGRTVSVVVRRANIAPTIANYEAGLVQFVTLPHRPDIRDHRALRRTIYDVTERAFVNTSNADLDLRFDLDRRNSGDTVHILRANSASDPHPDSRWSFHPDRAPMGVRGSFRIAAVQPDGSPDSVGSFASAPLRFNLRRQPVAPPAARMAINPGRNGGDWVITRTTQHMAVKVTCDGGVLCSDVTLCCNPRYAQLSRNITVNGLLALFAPTTDDVRPTPLPADAAGNYTFELRVIRPGRPDSAPGFLQISNAQMLGATTVRASVISNSNVDSNAQGAVRAAGVNVTLSSTAGLFDNLTAGAPGTGTDVSSWITNLPNGLTATVSRIAAGNSQIIINIRGTSTDATALPANTALEILIPAANLSGTVAGETIDGAVFLRVTNPDRTVSGQQVPSARFNIQGGTPVASTLVSVTTPGALSLDFTEAEAAVAAGGSASDWGLPGTAVITVAPAVSGSVAVITWDPVTGFNPAADSPQTLTVTGTIAGGLPQGITDPNGVIRPFEVEITVAAP